MVEREWIGMILSDLLAVIGVAAVFYLLYRRMRSSAKAQIALHDIHHRRLIRLHDNIPGIVYQAVHHNKQELRITYISNRIRDYGVAPEDIYKNSKTLSSMLHPDDYLRFHISAAKAAQYLTPFHEEYRLIHANGTSWIEERAVPSFEPDGNVLWDGMMIDITARKLAEEALSESEEKLKLMALALANSANGVLLAEVNGDSLPIVYLNPAFSEISGYNASEVMSQPLLFLHEKSPEDSPSLVQLREAVKKGEYSRALLQSLRKDGQPFWSDFSLSPIRNRFGDITHYVAVINNVTELENARQTAEKATAVKRDFLANMSHEIRTPLYGILGTVKLLSDSRLQGEQMQWVQLLRQTGNSLLNIINDILDFSKIEAGNLQLHEMPFSPIQLVNEVLTLQRKSSQEKPIVFKLDIDKNVPSYLIGDSERIRQIINNYLSNAIKFTEKGQITLSITSIDEGSDVTHKRIRFAVQDSGVGISPDKQEHVFEQFMQADASISRRYGGTGLGLAICRQLAELMHGKVGLQSEVGVGSTFWFEAGFVEHEETNFVDTLISPPPEHHIRFREQRILLAEDNPVNRAVTLAILNNLGLKVSVVENGKFALEAYKTDNYDLILMDVQMPVMGGLEASRLIRRLEAETGRRPVPIIAFTANVLEGFKKECIENGMDDYLTKPLRDDQIATTLSKYLAYDEELNQAVSTQEAPQLSTSGQLDSTHLDALRMLLGDQFDDLCSRFCMDTEERIASIKIHSRQQDYMQMAKVAHSVKSSAQNMGATQLWQTFRSIEQFKPDEGMSLETLIVQMEQQFNTVRQDLQNYQKGA